MVKKLTGMEWLKKHVSSLEITNSKFSDVIGEIKEIEPSSYNEFQEWTPLKLVLLNYALDTCTMIIKKKPFFKNMYYVDLFAGSGLNKIKGKEDFLIGSPLIAALNYSDSYTKMFFCENNFSFHNALDKRLKHLGKKNLNVFPEECFQCLDGISKVTSEPNTYAFYFIDPYSTEFDWESMKKILSINRSKIIGRDILFTFMSSMIAKYVGSSNEGSTKGEKLNRFFGDESWKKMSTINQIVSHYARKITTEFPETIVKVIKIQSKKHGFCYHLFFITNKTKNENPWLKSIDKVKQEVENNSDKSVEMALNIIKNRQMDLSQF